MTEKRSGEDCKVDGSGFCQKPDCGIHSPGYKNHHPSCRPHDRTLVYHCGQCGLDEFVSDDLESAVREVVAEKDAELARKDAALKCIVGEWMFGANWNRQDPVASAFNRAVLKAKSALRTESVGKP